MITRRHFWRIGAGLLAATGLKATAEKPEKPVSIGKKQAGVRFYWFLDKSGIILGGSTKYHPLLSSPYVPHPDDAKLTEEQKLKMKQLTEDISDYGWKRFNEIFS